MFCVRQSPLYNFLYLDDDSPTLRGFDISRQYLGPPDEMDQKIIDTILEMTDREVKVELDNQSSDSCGSDTPQCSPRADSLYLNNLEERNHDIIFYPTEINRPYEDDEAMVTLTELPGDLEQFEGHLDEEEWIPNEVEIENTTPTRKKSQTGSGHRKYVCDMCEKKFVRPAELSRHIRTHTNERPFSCNVCHQKFKRNDHLKSHETKHTKVKEHQCTICVYKTNRKDTLKRHIKNKHKNGLTKSEI
jgi:hypothetical protein